MRILVAGCNHRSAPLAVRERIAFDAESAQRALGALRARFANVEALILSTCNRVELYVARPMHSPPDFEQMLAFLGDRRGQSADSLRPVMRQWADRAAVGHLFQVVCSLDSMVLGETQILGQVKQAFSLAQQAGAVGPVLTRLGQQAIATARRVHAETSLSAGRVSVASVAAEFAQRVLPDLSGKTVLVLGAGKMAEHALDHLVKRGPRRVLIANRSRPRAEELAERHGGQPVELDRLTELLAEADVLIASTGSPRPLIDATMMRAAMTARRGRPIVLIDIAVPRDIEPAVRELEHVHLYNIDDLQEAVETNLGDRAERSADALRIVDQQVEQFMAWMKARSIGPTILALRDRLADLRDEELAWLLPKLTSASQRDRELIEQFAQRLVSKVMHDPVRELTQASESDLAADVYAQTLVRLFKLKPQATPSQAPPPAATPDSTPPADAV